MRNLSLVSLLQFLLIPGVVAAGPNAGGTLILHANTELSYTTGEDYCGQSGLAQCSDAVTSVSGTGKIVFFAVAAFPDIASPRLSGITFGVDYDDTEFVLVDNGSCGDFELPTSNWPSPGEGTAVTWETPQTAVLTDVYWFAGYNYYGNAQTFDLETHPTQGAEFADDSMPAALDPVVDFGRIGFETIGYLPCAGLPAPEGDGPVSGDDNGSESIPPPPPELTVHVRDQLTSAPIAGITVRIVEHLDRLICNDPWGCSDCDWYNIAIVQTGQTNAAGNVAFQSRERDCGFDDRWTRNQHSHWDQDDITIVEEPTEGQFTNWIAGSLDGPSNDRTLRAFSESYLGERFCPVLHQHAGLEKQAGLGDIDETVQQHMVFRGYNVGGQRIFEPTTQIHQYDDNGLWDSFGWNHVPGGYFYVGDIDDGILLSAGSEQLPLYYHVYPFEAGAVIEYWYWFNANDTRDQWHDYGYHEGDFEHSSIYITFDGVDWLPQAVNLYQHDGGQRVLASDCWWSETNAPTYYGLSQGPSVGRTHLHLWIASNSHASYNRFDPSYWIRAGIGGGCEVTVFDYVDYNISDNPKGAHSFFEYDALVPLGEYWSDRNAHGNEWYLHNEGPMDWMRYVGFLGHSGLNPCPPGCPLFVCWLFSGTGLANPYSFSPTAPLNEVARHNWRVFHTDPGEERWGNGSGTGFEREFGFYPLRNNYLGEFGMCQDGSGDVFSLELTPKKPWIQGEVGIFRMEGDLEFLGLPLCEGTEGCWVTEMTTVEGKYRFEHAEVSGSGVVSVWVWPQGEPNTYDALNLRADIASCGTSAVGEGLVQEENGVGITALPAAGSVSFVLSGTLPDQCRLAIYDVQGTKVRTLTVRNGVDRYRWNCNSSDGRMVPSGVYFVTIEAMSAVMASEKFVVVR